MKLIYDEPLSNIDFNSNLRRYAADLDAAAVIMASHGKGRVKEFFVGSVANYCLHRCKKPVVIFRSPPVAEHKSTVRPGQSPLFSR